MTDTPDPRPRRNAWYPPAPEGLLARFALDSVPATRVGTPEPDERPSTLDAVRAHLADLQALVRELREDRADLRARLAALQTELAEERAARRALEAALLAK